VKQRGAFVQSFQQIYLLDMLKTQKAYITKIATETRKIEHISIDLNKPLNNYRDEPARRL
jgi:hypothetical protein